MPAILINSLRANGMPTVMQVFRWDGTDDSGLVSFILTTRTQEWMQDIAVDRTGPAPVLRWQRYEKDNSDPNVPFDERDWLPTNDWRSLDLVVDDWIQAENFGVGWGPMIWPKGHYWECDEHGRAFSIDDLVVP